MKTKLRQAGFGAHGLIALLLVAGVIGAIGYTVYDHSQKDTTPPSITLRPDIPASIKTKADLQQTSKAVAATGDQLQSNLDTSSLTADVKSLL